MRIKKHKRNQYVISDGIWIRNPYSDAEAIDINDLTRNDIDLLLANEVANLRKKSLNADDLAANRMESVIICSDGHDWGSRHKLLAKIPNKNAKILGVNGSLSKWELVGDLSEEKRVMSSYVVNNPYAECISYLPTKHRYYPPLVASTRTNPKFIDGYLERPLFYSPTNNLNYSGIPKEGCLVLDDYRNPICAAISYCVKMGARKLVLFCCDESFSDERPGAERMKNGLCQYPQQIKSQKVIDAQLYWLRASGVEVFDCSSGIEYSNAAYIEPDNLVSFFNNNG